MRHYGRAVLHGGAGGRYPSTGKSVEFEATDIVRGENGKVAELWGATDTLHLMRRITADSP
ncbi:ester cyclase [Arthrobacter sp. RHLT1-20]